MTQAPLRPCRRPGCAGLTRSKGGFCDRHVQYGQEQVKQQRRRYAKQRGSAASQGYDRQWRKVAAIKKRINPWCEICNQQPATLIHHIESVKSRPDLRLHMDNLQAVCKRCHGKLHSQ